jgi:deoxyribodipyrimidine photo-lyase
VKPSVNIFWFRRDYRLFDNAGLYHALKSHKPVVPIFIFDKNILDKLDDKKDRRVAFIHNAIIEIQEKLLAKGSSLEVHYGYPNEIFKQLISKYSIDTVFCNHDYEPYATARDTEIEKILVETNAVLRTFKDQVIFEKSEIVKDDGTPYTIYTPYSKKWKNELNAFYYKPYNSECYLESFYKHIPSAIPTLQQMGFEQVDDPAPSRTLQRELISEYTKQRDYPAANGTSKMGVHLRFGTISIRALVQQALQQNETYLNELIWRDFYQMILWHFPRVGQGRAFRKQFEFIEWRNNEEEFQRWCKGLTGYPIVDAGMRELNATGFMHNRVRMIVASFLTKHLLIDWRWGEAYFAEKLLDFDLASNNGGWQWASGSGCDAAPYFRIFNPYIQTKKFDPEFKYIRRWVPEFEDFSYPKPIVEHEFARKRCLATYGRISQETIGKSI